MCCILTILNSSPELYRNRNLAKNLVHSNKDLSKLGGSVKYYFHCIENAKNVIENYARAEPLPVLNTRSMGHPQLTSTKSMFPAHSFERTSAVGTRDKGLFPATWTPKMDSEGCLRTNDHSSFDPWRKEVASPTEKHRTPLSLRCTLISIFHVLSPQVMSAPYETHRRRNGYGEIWLQSSNVMNIWTYQISDRSERCKIFTNRQLHVKHTYIPTYKFCPTSEVVFSR
jgi:hypothetical protein